MYGCKDIFADTTTGSPVIEIGYTQVIIFIAVPEEVDMVTYEQTEVVPRTLISSRPQDE